MRAQVRLAGTEVYAQALDLLIIDVRVPRAAAVKTVEP